MTFEPRAIRLGRNDRFKEADMRAFVVYESMYGNTAAIGEAIAAGLNAGGLRAEAGPLSKIGAAEITQVDLLVVGGPTHVHGMTTSASRKSVLSDEKNSFPQPTVEPGLREWLKRLPSGENRPAAAFDTRIRKPMIVTGSAAKGVGHRLKARGFQLVSSPKSFYVSTDNRLVDGELERAAAWAGELAERAADRRAVPGDRESRNPVSSG
jgi:hypothetical protein